jgi:hypothetical protein
MAERETNNETEDEWDRWQAWFEEQTRGIRVKTLKRFLLFYFMSHQRFRETNWQEWQARDLQNRQHVMASYDNYLSSIDNVEIEYYIGLELFGSERQIRDYWKTLYKLVVFWEG